jgi:hypothetical protein
LTELLVLVGMGAVLTGLLLPELSQTRSKLLEQACVSNLRQWGMVIYMYAKDNNDYFWASCTAGDGGCPDGVTGWDQNWANAASTLNSYWGKIPTGNPTAI